MTRSTSAGYDQDRLHTVRVREDAIFRSRIPRSLDLATRAHRSMPHGVPMAWMAGLYRHPPLFVAEGSGARFRDVDGNTYMDMNQSDMSMNYGYASPSIVAAASKRLRRGSQFLLPTEDAIIVSKLLAERFSIPYWQYTLSASSANTEALRLAHVATGRDKIVVFQGSYHGHIDDTLVEREGTTTVPLLLGTSAQVAKRTRIVPFNQVEALEVALAPGDVSAVITEPALTNSGTMYPNALSMATARTALQEILTLEGYQRVNKLGARLADGIEHATTTHGLSWRAHRLGGRSGFCLAPLFPLMQKMLPTL